MKEFFSYINPIDVVCLIIFVRTVYIGARRGPLVEVFKLLGMVVATFLTLHFYLAFAKVLGKFFGVSQATLNLLAFVLIWVAVAVIFKLLREGVSLLLGKAGERPSWATGVAVVLAVMRGILLCGLVFVGCLLVENPSWNKMVFRSQSSGVFKDVSFSLYKGIYDLGVKKFFPSEDLNDPTFLLKYPQQDFKD